MKKIIVLFLCFVFASSVSFAAPVFLFPKNLILATTTSTVDSGLLDVLIPIFEKESGYKIKTIGVGSGMAIEMGRKGEADVLLVHSPKDEENLVKDGFGVNRKPVMHNDFVLLGHSDDRAGVRSAKNAREAFDRIAASGSFFISRGDRSGTHKKELAIWPIGAVLSNLWYLEAGQGMGATLVIANQKNAYTLCDRATYLSFKDKIKLGIVYEGEQSFFNPYHVIEINPAKHSRVNTAGAKAFAIFITSAKTQKLIANFGKDKFGQSLFFPDVLNGND